MTRHCRDRKCQTGACPNLSKRIVQDCCKLPDLEQSKSAATSVAASLSSPVLARARERPDDRALFASSDSAMRSTIQSGLSRVDSILTVPISRQSENAFGASSAEFRSGLLCGPGCPKMEGASVTRTELRAKH